MSTMTLYQFDVSHFCEKARWALDHKRLAYRVHNLVPGPHRRTTRRLAPRSSVPILVDGAHTVQGSAEIITYLDTHYRHDRLTPVNAQDASHALEWERYADHNIGVPLRLFFYHYVLEDARLARGLLTAGGPWWTRVLYAFAFPAIRRRLREGLHIDDASARAAEARLVASFEYLEQRIAGHRFLAGSLFSRADLAVSALLAPCWRQPERMPAAVQAFIETHQGRPALAWGRHVYEAYRGARASGG